MLICFRFLAEYDIGNMISYYTINNQGMTTILWLVRVYKNESYRYDAYKYNLGVSHIILLTLIKFFL
jgi:hypothetical protein